MDGVALRVLVTVVAFAALTVQAACGSSPATSWDLAPFRSHLGEYAALERAPAARTAGAFQGKVIFVKTGRTGVRYDYVLEFERRHRGLLAYDPAEVGAVVFVRELYDQLGSYDGGGRALVCFCTLTVVDRRSGEVVARRTFTGGPPPTCAPAGRDAAGPLPLCEMMDFVAGLSGR